MSNKPRLKKLRALQVLVQYRYYLSRFFSLILQHCKVGYREDSEVIIKIAETMLERNIRVLSSIPGNRDMIFKTETNLPALAGRRWGTGMFPIIY